MNASELNARLRVLLSSELGTYSNGTASIWVYGSNSLPPSVSNGMECLIRQIPIGYARSSSSGQKYKPQEWEITLKNYKKDSSIDKAIRKIEQSFAINEVVHMPFTTETIEQARIRIKDPIFFKSL